MKTVILMLTSAVAIAGQVLAAGNLVEVTEPEAKDLLRRGKAKLHDHDPESGDAVTSSGSGEPELRGTAGVFEDLHREREAERQAEIAAMNGSLTSENGEGNAYAVQGVNGTFATSEEADAAADAATASDSQTEQTEQTEQTAAAEEATASPALAPRSSRK